MVELLSLRKLGDFPDGRHNTGNNHSTLDTNCSATDETMRQTKARRLGSCS